MRTLSKWQFDFPELRTATTPCHSPEHVHGAVSSTYNPLTACHIIPFLGDAISMRTLVQNGVKIPNGWQTEGYKSFAPWGHYSDDDY
jgi:hypothetical protein